MSEVSPIRSVVLLCAPSLGILDNWLPVMSELKTRDASVCLVAIVPQARTMRQVVPDDTVIALADELFDEVVFREGGGRFRSAPSFARWSSLAWLNGLLARLGDRAQRWGVAPGLGFSRPLARRALLVGAQVVKTRPVRWVLAVVDRLAGRHAATSLDRVAQRAAVLCYDVSEEAKDYNEDVLERLAHLPRHSMHHGITVVEPDDPPPSPVSEQASRIAYLFSEHERSAYRHNFGLSDHQLRVVGIPRHSPSWVAHVVDRSAERHEVPWDGFVLVISRPDNPRYLPRDRKVRALREIRQVAVDEFGLRLVVKTHPKESHQGLFEEALGLHRYGESWLYSRAHPLHLASRSLAAVCFFSGVAVDMVDRGVPVVERLDLRGLPDYDNAEAVRDAHGRPSLVYRQHGLVLPADDLDELRERFTSVVVDRDGVVATLRRNYARTFASASGAIDGIAAGLLPAVLEPGDERGRQ